MKWIYLSELPGGVDVVHALIPVYTALKASASRENNLRAFLVAEMMLESFKSCLDCVDQPKWHYHPARFHYIEDTDSVEEILAERFSYVYNPIMG